MDIFQQIYGKVLGKQYTELGRIRIINKIFRENDQSHLFPICGKYNVTERAIRNLRNLKKQGLVFDDYARALEQEISRLVNNY